jgi:alkaline phosphatase
MIRQTLLFDMAVREVLDFAQRDGHTLVIVTADHETGGLKLVSNKDNEIEAKWTSTKHTAANVPIYAYGPGSEQFAGLLDNTDIPKRLAALAGIEQFPVILKSTRIPEKVSAP